MSLFRDIVCKLFCINAMPRSSRNSRTGSDTPTGGAPDTGSRRREVPKSYWILTIPHASFTPFLPQGVQWIKGQLELGNESNYLHWQLLCYFKQKKRLTQVKTIFGNGIHAEPTRSEASETYVFKEDTRVNGTQFELGTKPFRRNNANDWERVWELAKQGNIESIPADIRVSNYRTLKQIEKDFLKPVAQEKEVFLFWGRTGTGKSRRAWSEAGLDAYPKDPRTKYWDAYRGEENVVIDEFRGGIDISHLLRWLDRYPVNVECKFGATTLRCKKIWITSNLPPREWYPQLGPETLTG